MVRTVVSLPDDDKRWLDRRAAQEGVSMTELIRRAVRLLREQGGAERPAFEELLERTAGTWKRGDGLRYQRKTRREW
jgi:Arc/MetJ-type ribon-helix-helix transcriptional regulator